MTATLPLISARREELTAADDRLRRLRAEAAALSALRVPDGTGTLDADVTAARADLATGRPPSGSAEDADAAARDALAAGPQRAPLELARAHRAEHARHQAARTRPGRRRRASTVRAPRGPSAAVDTAAAALGRGARPP